MERQTSIKSINIFETDEGWRAEVSLFSTVDDEENFSANLNLPIDDPNITPDEIKKEVSKKLVKTFEEVTSWLTSQ